LAPTETITSERNPYLFECFYDLDRALNKYSLEDRTIIYYYFFMEIPTKYIHFYTPSQVPVHQEYIDELRAKLRNDPDLLELMKER
jgi:hypothetical protein